MVSKSYFSLIVGSILASAVSGFISPGASRTPSAVSLLATTSSGTTTTCTSVGVPFTGALETIPSLASLYLLPYVDADTGLINLSASEDGFADAKPSSFVFAIYDKNENPQYIGVTNHMHHMLKVMLARRPDKTYFYKTFHIAKPSRSYIDLVMDFWLAEVGDCPGNAGGPEDDLWEKPLDVKPRFTDQDYEDIEELEKTGHLSRDMATRIVTWQWEEEKMNELRARGVKEEFHFDPTLKSEGKLDLKAEEDGGSGRNLQP
uniref:GIY-YIG domain-containing protein n=1 Tax=Minutocellus polymorphus TaxID=265543 RepID=A0A6U0ITV5_9STRA|mmetsp:Transcript_13494/g.22449  ORF Transcript_13494/g.22449 Transcript_13494/m.22449 type:complete len:261 (+) Transcript_13494:77-859(+)